MVNYVSIRFKFVCIWKRLIRYRREHLQLSGGFASYIGGHWGTNARKVTLYLGHAQSFPRPCIAKRKFSWHSRQRSTINVFLFHDRSLLSYMTIVGTLSAPQHNVWSFTDFWQQRMRRVNRKLGLDNCTDSNCVLLVVYLSSPKTQYTLFDLYNDMIDYLLKAR